MEVVDEIAVTLSIGAALLRTAISARKREHDECSLDGTPVLGRRDLSPVDPGGDHGSRRGPRRPLCRPSIVSARQARRGLLPVSSWGGGVGQICQAENGRSETSGNDQQGPDV